MRRSASSRAARALLIGMPALLALGAALGPRAAAAAPSTGSSSALLRLPEVRTRVEPPTPSLEETGVTRARIDSLVAARLAVDGVPARSSGDAAGAGGDDGLLTVQATYLINSGWHIVSLSLYLSRSANLAASPETEVTSTVWSRGGVVIARKKKLQTEVGSTLAELLDAFAQDYRSSNTR